ncbi:MAG: hypothetical protein WCV41_02300 [Patescibacteria group bacterium]
MKNIFLVLGYGIPKNIIKDENYNFYLKTVFNVIYDDASRHNFFDPLIIFSGGKTNLRKPYQKTEGEEMLKLFLSLLKNKSYLKKITEKWQLIAEKNALSTLENILNCKKIVAGKKFNEANVNIFFEQTRKIKVEKLAKKVFGNKYKIKIQPIDFDNSKNRYLDYEFVQKKETAELKHAFWALENKNNLKKYHALHLRKINYLRKYPDNSNMIKDWWDKEITEINQNNYGK